MPLEQMLKKALTANAVRTNTEQILPEEFFVGRIFVAQNAIMKNPLRT
jgi:hypothetical protein